MLNTDLQQEEYLRQELMGNASSETYRKNYLVEAGAGAGKTYIMVNRIVNQLLRGEIRPEHLAAITFTEKATQELLERLDTELMERYRHAVMTEGPESAVVRHLKNLMDSVDQLQVSTIHSFCRRLLMTMPYASALGPEFELVEDSETYAGAFFDRTIELGAPVFDRARQITGVSYEDLKYNFLQLCESGAEPVCAPADPETVSEKLEEMRSIAELLYVRLREAASLDNVNNISSKTVQKLLPQIHEVLRLKACPQEEFVAALLDAANPLVKAKTICKEAVVRVFPGKLKDNNVTIGGRIDRIAELWGELIHALCMSAIRDLITAYRDYKRKNRVASQNDLLLCTRDMLRDSREARKYFHRRYQTVYVDEMQDTDPIQAQILFYLATDEADFDATDWRNCRPAAGSLFLVGDPKQAIYRFRGADISVYMILTELFAAGVGETVRLHFNYRSASEITDYTDRAFAGRLCGGKYQAEYSPMTAVHGSSEHARLIGYTAGEDCDAERVAALIATAVASGTHMGIAGNVHPAQYSDFMVLTRKNASTERYVQALAAYGIPCNMAGARKFSEVRPITRANYILQHLLDRRDETKLALVLANCYGVPLPVLRSYRQRVGRLTADYLCAKKAFLEEGSLSPALEQIFSAMTELEDVNALIGRVPAMTVLEHIFFKTAGIWQQEGIHDRSADYAMVSQYLKKLREAGYLSFPALAAKAMGLAGGRAERELLLEEKENCVRIMNLHKAKGLEAEAVILAFDGPFTGKAFRHAVFDGNTITMHSCFTRPGPYGGENILAAEPGWAEAGGPAETEKAFLEAEIERLRYVAATRAKSCLLINTTRGKAWDAMGEALAPADGAAEGKSAAEAALHTDADPAWQQAILALYSAEGSPLADDGSGQAVPVTASAAELEQDLIAASAAASVCAGISVTPSQLEGNQKNRLKRELEDDSDRLPAESTEEEPESHPAESKAEDPNQLPTESRDRTTEPHGPDWGTILHRTLELAVKHRHWSDDALSGYARQAICETLGNLQTLTARQREQLLDGYTDTAAESTESPESPEDRLQAQVVAATAFIRNPDSELRRLIEGATCYTELPFILREQDPTSRLATAVYAILGGAPDRHIGMNGVIDLAVRGQEGWTIVDYKTDIRWPDESEEDLIRRLKQQYTSQLLAYREVLARLGMGRAEAVFICSIALGGRLIPVLQGENMP